MNNNKNQVYTETAFQDPFSEEVWRTTYKDYKDTCIQDTWRRVARDIASVENTESLRLEWEEKFYDMLEDFKVVPGGRIQSNAGTEWASTTYFNCFVAPIPENDVDSIEGIYKYLKNAAHTLKSEGGVGISANPIRPRGSFINGVGVESPGSIKFMELFDKSSEIVTAGSGLVRKNSKAKGKIRKGAQMLSQSIFSPDIVEFITAKQIQGRLTKFNMSVAINDIFMEKVIKIDQLEKAGASEEEISKYDSWDLIFPDTNFEKYKEEWDGNYESWLSKGYPVIVYETTSVRRLWNLILSSTYSRNEPGVLFLERANKLNPARAVENIITSNPCGEIPLPPGGICCLGTLNLVKFLKADCSGFDLEKIVKYAKVLVRFLDNVNTRSDAPLPEYVWSKEHKRRIGAGVMGWGSSLIMLKTRFASEKAAEIREELMSTFAKSCYEASIDLAIEKGMYSVCNKEDVASTPFVQRLNLSDEYMFKLKTYGIRNSALTSCQPNGNGSIEAGIVTGGLEPLFLFDFVRTSIVNEIPEEIRAVTPDFSKGVFEETSLFKWAKEGDEDILKGVSESGVIYKIDRNRGLTKETLCEDYGVRYLRSIGEWDSSADWAVTSMDLTAKEHVDDLAGFCKWLDNSASKTVNLPNDYTYKDFKDLYLYAYNTGYIKGVTTYRAGTMTSVLSAKEESSAAPEDEEIILEEIKLPDSLPCTLKTLKSEGRKWYLTIVLNEAQTRPVALFANTNSVEKNTTANNAVERLHHLAISKGIPTTHIDTVLKKMGCDSNTTKICRFISLNLRHGVLVRNIVSTLDQVDCLAGSFVFHIRKFLAGFIKDGEKVVGEVCDSCGSKDSIVYQEGCKICKSCGTSKCG